MTRAFVAIRPPAEVLDAIEARVHDRPMGARRVPRDQWHLTLQFLGDHADVDAVASALCRDPFDVDAGELRLGGADVIGDRHRARILMLGLHEGGAWMTELAGEVERRVAPLGYRRAHGEAPFLPHLTLARFRTPADLGPLCAAIGRDPVGPRWRAEELSVFESRLRPQGAEHLVRARVPIGRIG